MSDSTNAPPPNVDQVGENASSDAEKKEIKVNNVSDADSQSVNTDTPAKKPRRSKATPKKVDEVAMAEAQAVCGEVDISAGRQLRKRQPPPEPTPKPVKRTPSKKETPTAKKSKADKEKESVEESAKVEKKTKNSVQKEEDDDEEKKDEKVRESSTSEESTAAATSKPDSIKPEGDTASTEAKADPSAAPSLPAPEHTAAQEALPISSASASGTEVPQPSLAAAAAVSQESNESSLITAPVSE